MASCGMIWGCVESRYHGPNSDFMVSFGTFALTGWAQEDIMQTEKHAWEI